MDQFTSAPLPDVLRRRSRRWSTALSVLAVLVSAGVDGQDASYSDPSSQRQRDHEAAAARRNQEIERAKRDAAQQRNPAQPSESPRTPEIGQGVTGNGVPYSLPRGIPIDTLVPRYLATLRSSASDCGQFSELAKDPNPGLVSYFQHEQSCLQSCMDLASASFAACVFFSKPESERVALETFASTKLRDVDQRLAEGSGCGCLAAAGVVRDRLAPIVEYVQRNRSELRTAERSAEEARRDRYAQEQKAAAETEAWKQQQANIRETQARAGRLLNSADDWLPIKGENARREAEKKAREALALVPDAEGALFTLARLTADPAEKSRLYEKVVAATKGGYHLPLLALAYRGLGNHTEAAKVAKGALAVNGYARMQVGLTAIAREPEVIQAGGIDAFTRDDRRVLAGNIRSVGGRGLYDAEYLSLKKLDAAKRLARLRPHMVELSSSSSIYAAATVPCASGSVVECSDAFLDAGEIVPWNLDSAYRTFLKGACAEGSLKACDRVSRKYQLPQKPLSSLPAATGYLVDACENSAAGCGLLGEWLRSRETFGDVHLTDVTSIPGWRAQAYRIACQVPQENSFQQKLCEHDGVWRDDKPDAGVPATGYSPPWYTGYSYF